MIDLHKFYKLVKEKQPELPLYNFKYFPSGLTILCHEGELVIHVAHVTIDQAVITFICRESGRQLTRPASLGDIYVVPLHYLF